MSEHRGAEAMQSQRYCARTAHESIGHAQANRWHCETNAKSAAAGSICVQRSRHRVASRAGALGVTNRGVRILLTDRWRHKKRHTKQRPDPCEPGLCLLPNELSDLPVHSDSEANDARREDRLDLIGVGRVLRSANALDR